MNIDALVEYITTTPLIWLILTIGSFKLGIIIYEKFDKHTLLQPIIISYVVIMSALFITDVSYEEYFKGVEIIHFFLGPATVALALPLYNNLKHIKSLFFTNYDYSCYSRSIFNSYCSFLIMGIWCRTSNYFINDYKVNHCANCYYYI